ncbi:MAG: hypothetical protein NT171_08200 [Planctomycetota bacterium]|jgi:hypothetical protein|nr:hypothetical protein [Planctomycetota bacterium]
MEGATIEMRLLLVDHGCCDPPHSRVFRCRDWLLPERIEVLACGPASVSALAAPTPGLHGIHLRDIAAANRTFARAVRDGTPQAFLDTSPTIPARLLGLVRETARQAIAEAVDGFDPAVILVLHAGIFADLAVETGVPVVIHVGPADLAAARQNERVHGLLAAALVSAEVVMAADATTERLLTAEWLDAAATNVPVAGVDESGGPALAAAVRLAARRRGGGGGGRSPLT